MKRSIFVVGLLLSTAASANCDKCKDSGYEKVFVDCYLCQGHKTVSPSYYGNAVGVTRWTVESTYIQGVKVGEWESEKRYKKYSMIACPLCKNSKRRGKIHTIRPCSCGRDLKDLNRQNCKRLKGLLKSLKIEQKKPVDEADFFWTRLMFEKRNNWLWDSKNKKKTLSQAINDEYDVEGANYGRERESDR